MKKQISALVLIAALCTMCASCSAKNGAAPASTTGKSTAVLTTQKTQPGSTQPVSPTKPLVKTKITTVQAEKLLLKYYGIKDKKTGNTYSYAYLKTVAIDGKKYYAYSVNWLVDGDHYSFVGNIFVSLDGKAIYTGKVGMDDSASIDNNAQNLVK